jgi:hypothetical protein
LRPIDTLAAFLSHSDLKRSVVNTLVQNHIREFDQSFDCRRPGRCLRLEF